ncbi:hypothetical protein BDL97_06G039000 [Sphagnum fallax]|nr:hypothetical protein BDL97_06G039000 [Sphagnum fallax]
MGLQAEAKWWSKDTVAVVTGASKGIGFEIVRQLAKEGITVVLTARDATRGAEAIESLKKKGFQNVNFHTLDVGSQESIDALAEWLRTTYGGIDILGLPNKDYVTTLTDREHITEDFVDSFVNKYLEDVANGNHNKGDWPDLTKLGWEAPVESYAVSKIAVIAYVSALHNTLVARHEGEKKINVFSSCPGHVRTDLAPNGIKTVEEGADTPVWLALHSPKEGLGKLYGERTILDF